MHCKTKGPDPMKKNYVIGTLPRYTCFKHSNWIINAKNLRGNVAAWHDLNYFIFIVPLSGNITSKIVHLLQWDSMLDCLSKR